MKNIEKMSIDDKIEYWHTHETENSLREFLGMTKQEYLEFCLPKQAVKDGENYIVEKGSAGVMTTNKTLRSLKKMGDLMQQLANIKETLNKSELFEDLSSWDVVGIYYNCKIKNGKLYTDADDLLSYDGICMDEEIPYFVNQYTGYCEDAYYGTMFIRVDDLNTFVAVAYGC